jgi:hypothetical protein
MTFVKLAFVVLIIIATAIFGIFGIDLKINNRCEDELMFQINLSSDVFSTLGKFRISNDGKFFDPAHNKFYFGHYFQIVEGWIKVEENGVVFKAGRIIPEDEVTSPYSLFISSEKNSFVSMLLSYENALFFFKTQWLGLTNKFSDLDIYERGTNYRTFGLKLGDFRLGYQEAVIYTQRYFDFEYFFNPIPNFFTQYSRLNTLVLREGTNDSSILGFFADYLGRNVYVYAQILVDDFNMNRFYGGFQNPDKIAWSIGGKYKTSFGWIYMYHAGATKYTFEPSIAGLHDEYVHYPVAEISVGEATRMVAPEENYIGYKYGENNIAFLMGFNSKSKLFDSDIYIEYVLSGAKSPLNPWHENVSVPEGTHLLDDDILEHIFRVHGEISKEIGDFKVGFSINYENIVNPLEVIDSPDGEGEIYAPSKGNESDFQISMSLSVSF